MVQRRGRTQAHGRSGLGLALGLGFVVAGLIVGWLFWMQPAALPANRAAVDDSANLPADAQRLAELEHALNAANTEAEHLAALEMAKAFDPAQLGALGDHLCYAEFQAADHSAKRFESLEAIKRLNAALERIVGANPSWRSALLSMLGELWIDLGVLDRAIPAIREAVVQADLAMEDLATVNFGGVYNAYMRRAKLALALGDSRQGAIDLERFIESAAFAEIKKKFRETEGRLERNVATLDALLGGLWGEVAREDPAALIPAIEAFERVFANNYTSPRDRSGSRAKLLYLALLADDLELAQATSEDLRTEIAAGFYPHLDSEQLGWIAALEAWLARASGIDVEPARSKLEEAFARMMDDWRSVDRQGGVGFLRYGGARLVVDQLIELSSVERGLEVVYESQCMGVLWSELGGRRGELEEAVARLTSAQAGCLVFAPGKDRSWVFAVDANGVMREPIAGAGEIDQSLVPFMGELRRSPTTLTTNAKRRRADKLEEHGATLAATLLPAPILERMAGWSHVRVVGLELLGRLAIEALPIPEGEVLGTSKAISRLPSLPVGLELQRRLESRANSETNLLMLAAPRTASEFDFLPEIEVARGHLEGVLARFKDSQLMFGDEASVEGLRSALANLPGILHLLTHGFLDDADELRPRLLLTPDASHPSGELTYRDICRMSVGELVVLSSCRSGEGTLRIGDSGATHLGGAFLQAGAACVVLSEEEIRLNAILAFNDAFYKHAGSGVSVAEALRLARLELSKGSEFDDPYYWALVHSYGVDPSL